jgi:hypothetical protein
MSVFNYIDTFFFISLGITFVLLLLLVLHFKNRLVTLEEKTDTIFEIVNNVVQELNNMKRFHYSAQPHTSIPGPGPIHTIYDNTGALNSFATGKIFISDDEDDDSEDDDEDDEDEDSENDSEDDDLDDGLEVNIIHEAALNIESTDLNDIPVLSSENEIKMVEINIGEPIVDIDVEKLDNSIPPETEAPDDGSVHGDTENKDIHTMTLPELRKLASSRGINHSNKLKKGELIQLLEKESI